MTTETTIHQLATEAWQCFESVERPGHEPESFSRLREGSPTWVEVLVKYAHDDPYASGGLMLPDDYRYDWAREACEYLSGGEIEDVADACQEFADGVTPYTGERFAWLASNLARQSYVDAALQELGVPDNLAVQDCAMDRLCGLGIYRERETVFQAVYDYLDDVSAAVWLARMSQKE